MVRQLVRPYVQLAVSHRRARADDGDALGLGGGPHLEHFVEATAVAFRLLPRLVPLDQQPSPLILAQKRQLREALLGVGDDAAEQNPEVFRHALDGRVFEEVGVALEDAGEPFVRLPERQRQVELRGPPFRGHMTQTEPRYLQPLAHGVLPREEHLKERVAAQLALHVQFFHQLLERHILVRVSAERRLAHAPE